VSTETHRVRGDTSTGTLRFWLSDCYTSAPTGVKTSFDRGLLMFRLSLLLTLTCVNCFAFQAGPDLQAAERMQAAFEKAQADSIRPGDEKLDCDALKEEMIENASKPEVQAYVEKSGAWAKKEKDAMKPGKGRVAVQTAVSVFSSVVPGGDWAGIMAAKAQAPMQQAQTMQRLQEHMQMMNEMIPIMPYMMRGQRVVDLAKMRSCDWAKDANTGNTDPAATPKDKN
jgi:hypothetical protein